MRAIVDYVEQNIHGRVANKVGDKRTNGVEILLDFVERAGAGNYLEIGTLFGGSAIAVALWKQQLDQDGFVFCIDPLDGYYRKYASRDDMIDTRSGVPVTTKTLFGNITTFGVDNRIFVMKSNSTNIINFDTMKFSVAYIDGDHRDGVPLQDWFLVKYHVTDYVIFDNYSFAHPEVLDAGSHAINDPWWKEVYSNDMTLVVMRI